MFIIKLVIIFFIYIILAHILRSSNIYEGMDQDLSASYQQQSPNINQSDSATTARQAGTISHLNDMLNNLRDDVDNMNDQLNKMTQGLTDNTSKVSTQSKTDQVQYSDNNTDTDTDKDKDSK